MKSKWITTAQLSQSITLASIKNVRSLVPLSRPLQTTLCPKWTSAAASTKHPGFLSELSTFNSDLLGWVCSSSCIPPGERSYTSHRYTSCSSSPAIKQPNICPFEDATASSPETKSIFPNFQGNEAAKFPCFQAPPFSVKCCQCQWRFPAFPPGAFAIGWVTGFELRIFHWGGGQSRYTLRELSPPAPNTGMENLENVCLKMNETLVTDILYHSFMKFQNTKDVGLWHEPLHCGFLAPPEYKLKHSICQDVEDLLPPSQDTLWSSRGKKQALFDRLHVFTLCY